MEQQKIDLRKKMIITGLRKKMEAVGATYHALAKASGVDVRTIYQATKEKPVLHANGEAIVEALSTRPFKRCAEKD